MSEKIIPGDPDYANKVRWTVMAILVLVGISWFWIKGKMDLLVRTAETNPQLAAEQVHSFSQNMAYGMWALGIIAAIFLLRIAFRIFRSGQYPTPGAKVMRPTKVVTGASAHIRGLFAAILGSALCSGAIVAGLMVLAAVSRIAPPPQI